MNAIIYCRVSTKDQVDGTSLSSQKEACLEYAAKRGFTIVRMFVEEGESAKYADRTELLKLIEFCRDRKNVVQALVVWKLDRFARNVQDHFAVKGMLAKYGVAVHSVTEPIDAQPVGKLMETMLAGFAQFDNDIRSIRSLGGMQRRIADGIYPWRAPIGYMRTSSGRKTEPDTPDPERFPIIQEAWRQVIAGTATKADVQRMFSRAGLTSRKGLPVSIQTVDYIFRNKYYAGILVDPWSGTEYPGKHVPMVTPEEFALARANLNRRNRRLAHVRMRDDFPLRSCLRCDACNRPVTASWTTGRNKKYAYYHCHDRRCERFGKSLPAEGIHDAFLKLLGRLAPKRTHVPAIAKKIEETLATRSKTDRAGAERSRTRLAQLTRENLRLIEMRQKDLIGEAEFRAAHRKLGGQIAAAQATVATYGRKMTITASGIADTLTALSRLPDLWTRMALPVRVRFQHVLFPEGVTPETLGTANAGRLFYDSGEMRTMKTCLAAPTSETWDRSVDRFLSIHKELQTVRRSQTLSEKTLSRDAA